MTRERDKMSEVLQDIIERLEEIRDEIGLLNEEALDLTKTASRTLHDDGIYESAKRYWRAHIEGNTAGRQYSGSMHNLYDTIDDIKDRLSVLMKMDIVEIPAPARRRSRK